MKYVMTLDQYMHLLDVALKNKDIASLTKTNNTDGTIVTHDVDLTYHFDGTALQFNVIKKHTLAAKVASDTVIERHIDELIAQVLSTPADASAPVSNVAPQGDN